MCFKRLRVFFLKLFFRKKEQPKISLLIPFSSSDPVRKKSLKWLLEYWKHELPEAEVIIGHSYSKIFCKGEALNRAARKSSGKVMVILDADAYLPGSIINYCADRILEELDNHLWYVPYRRLYRLRRHITQKVLDSDPSNPLRLPSPPSPEDVEDNMDRARYGHRYGAMIMMFPREAYKTLGCFDERFKGWGGEDIALLRALDTLYGKHKTTNNDVLHLWHPFIGQFKSKMWEGQKGTNVNSNLANRYHRATRHPSKMRKLVDEGCKHRSFWKINLDWEE